MPYTAADTYSDKIIYHSTDQLSECDSAPMCCCGTHSTASCLCGLSSCAVFCIDPRVVVVCSSSCSKAQRGVRCTCWPGSEYRSWWTLHSPRRTSAQIAGSCGGARPSPAASVQPAGEKSYHQNAKQSSWMINRSKHKSKTFRQADKQKAVYPNTIKT